MSIWNRNRRKKEADTERTDMTRLPYLPVFLDPPSRTVSQWQQLFEAVDLYRPSPDETLGEYEAEDLHEVMLTTEQVDELIAALEDEPEWEDVVKALTKAVTPKKSKQVPYTPTNAAGASIGVFSNYHSGTYQMDHGKIDVGTGPQVGASNRYLIMDEIARMQNSPMVIEAPLPTDDALAKQIKHYWSHQEILTPSEMLKVTIT